MRSAISFADALRAALRLEPVDDEARERVLQMLGLTRLEEVAAPPAIGVWRPSSTGVGTRVEAPRTPLQAVVPPSPAVSPPPAMAARARGRRTVVRELQAESTSPVLPGWLLAPGDTLPPAPIDVIPALPTPPLIPSRTRRAILAAALATVVNEGEIDVDGIVALFTEARPLVSVPRLRVRTLRRGAQVLVDVGTGMDPYRSDVDQILEAFDDILVDDRMSVSFFSGSPSRGVFAVAGAPDEPWSPPPPDTPVVVITDLGIGGPVMAGDRAPVTEWLAFARRVHASQHPLIALVPYEARRWPPRLARTMTLLHWSERTTVGEVRRAMREALRTW